MQSEIQLSITGTGMVCPVGWEATTACAAIRAGLSRPRENHNFLVLGDNAEGVPINSHPIFGFTDGFINDGLWIRIAEGTFYDLITSNKLPDKSDTAFWKNTGIILVVPRVGGERHQMPNNIPVEDIKRSFGYRLLNALDYPISHANLYIVSDDHTGCIKAIILGSALIKKRNVLRIIILACDSYLDAFTLEWLHKYDRLLSDRIGLIPGEAGAGFILELEREALRRKARPVAHIGGAFTGTELNNFYSKGVNMGLSLSNAIKHAYTDSDPFYGELIVDLNGEDWRAAELSGARMRLGERISKGCPVIMPAVNIGDTGAASGAVSVCCALHSFKRNCAPSKNSLVISSTAHGSVGAVWLIRAG